MEDLRGINAWIVLRRALGLNIMLYVRALFCQRVLTTYAAKENKRLGTNEVP